MKKIKYFSGRFYPDEEGFFELPEGTIVVKIDEKAAYVETLVPVLQE